MAERYVGSPIQRLEDARYLLGQGLFIDDIKLPGMVCAHFLRSPHSHARIQKIDSEPARKTPRQFRQRCYPAGGKIPPNRPVKNENISFKNSKIAPGIPSRPNMQFSLRQ